MKNLIKKFNSKEDFDVIFQMINKTIQLQYNTNENIIDDKYKIKLNYNEYI